MSYRDGSHRSRVPEAYTISRRDSVSYSRYLGLHVSEATVSRALARSEVSRKVTQRVAAQRDDVRRMEYYMNIDHYTPEQLVYVDESAANERTLDRKYGWAPKGLPPIDIKLLHRSTRWSILPAYTINGYLPQPLSYKAPSQVSYLRTG